MVIARASLLPLFALPGLFNPAHTTAVADLLDATPPSSSLSSAFHLLNITVGGSLHTSVPFEKACSSILEGQPVNVSAAACAALLANYTNPLYRVDHFGAYMNTQWETCQSSKVTDGCLLDSSNVSNPLAFEGVNCRLGNVPPYYINVRSATDVQAALAFSNSTGVPCPVIGQEQGSRCQGPFRRLEYPLSFELRNTSHNAQFRPAGCSENTTYNAITTGAGVITQDLYEFADSVNRTIIGGYHQTVGFSGGYLLGGGHSILSPVYGLAVDRVVGPACTFRLRSHVHSPLLVRVMGNWQVQVQVVTPDGVYRTANECQNQDPFFALRGGGGSAFGVVLESTHRTEPKFVIQTAVLRFTPTGTDLADWYALTVNNSLKWANDGWGGHIVGLTLIYVNPLLNATAARTSMQPAIGFVTARKGSATVEELPSWLAFFEKYVPSAEAVRLSPPSLKSRLSSTGRSHLTPYADPPLEHPVGVEFSGGSRLLPSRLFSTAAGRAQLSALINETLADADASLYIVAGTPWLYKPVPGAAGATATTPAWRDAVWHLEVGLPIGYNDTLADRADGYRAASKYTQGFRNLAPESGAYFNEGDVYEQDHEVAHWGTENYKKLLAVKQR
ncbi:FAD-binding domain-containing protein [Ganoderma leucocontextum]|nr:FAD-binding domain-containing protein [Ganoderma leucocontextum]